MGSGKIKTGRFRSNLRVPKKVMFYVHLSERALSGPIEKHNIKQKKKCQSE